MQSWLSNILDIPELTSKIVILGNVHARVQLTLHSLHTDDQTDHRPEKWQTNLII